MRGLGKHGVIGAELADAMSRAAGFRNLLVHQYGRIDDAAVVGFLDRLDQLERFVEGVLTWLEDEADATSG